MVINAAKASLAHINREARNISSGLGAKKTPKNMSVMGSLEVLQLKTEKTTVSTWSENIFTGRTSSINVAISVLENLFDMASQMVDIASEAKGAGVTQERRNTLGASFHTLYNTWDNIAGSAINPDNASILLAGAPADVVVGQANISLPATSALQANAFFNAGLIPNPPVAPAVPPHAIPAADQINFSDVATSTNAENAARAALGNISGLLAAWKAVGATLDSHADNVSDTKASLQDGIDEITNTDVAVTAQDLATLQSVGQLLASMSAWVSNIKSTEASVSASIVQR